MSASATACPLAAPMHVGPLRLKNRVLLAPLAGVSDVPFRRICQELGAGLTYVEMLATNAVIEGNRRTLRTISRHPSEQVLGVQITGPNPEQHAQAGAKLAAEGFDTVDINMGCPVKKVFGRGWGSAILADLDRAETTARATVGAVPVPVSVKIRLGVSRDRMVVEEASDRLARAGAAMLTIHGRTRCQNYGTPVDCAAIRKGHEAARAAAPGIVTVGNGDVMDRPSAERMLAETGCDAVMVSRGALGNPWIFRELTEPDWPGTTLEEWLDVVLRHLDYHQQFYGTDLKSTVTVRKHLLWYVSGFPLMREMRDRMSRLTDLDVVREDMRRYAAGMPPGLRRYEDTNLDEVERRRDATHDPKFEMDRELDRGVV